MSSLIALYFVSVELLIAHTPFVPLFTLKWYNNNYNNNLLGSLFLAHNYSLFCSQPFCKHCTYSSDLHNHDLQTPNVPQFWLNYYWLSSAMSCPFIVQQDQPNERSWTGRFAYSVLENSIATACICAFSVCHLCLLLLVCLDRVLCICKCVTFALSIYLILILGLLLFYL